MVDRNETIRLLKSVHNGYYDYIIDADIVRSHDRITIICPKHGEFQQEYRHHLKGAGCKKCANIEKNSKRTLTTEQFIERSKKVHGDKYDYAKTKYVNSNTKVVITCPKHGDFLMYPFKHMNGSGCPSCRRKYANNDEFVDACKEIHGNNLTFEKVSYRSTNDKVIVTCPKHGDFEKYPYQLINRKEGCPYCSKEIDVLNKTYTTADFINAYKGRFGDDIYDFSKACYINSNEKIEVICHETSKNGIEHGSFLIRPSNLMQGYGCPKCANEKHSSSAESEIYDFITKEIGLIAVQCDKTKIGDELDIFIPDKNVAIEFDGLYWHSESKGKSKNYHLNKTEKCEEHGIRLIHIFEDEWQFKKEIAKSRLLSILGQNKYKIYARDCVIKPINSKISSDFINRNHLQGNVNAKYRYGLYHNGELVSVMTFCGLRKNLGNKSADDEYELLRFCNKLNTSVIGGASKLLKCFIKEMKPKRIISYADKRWSNGDLYHKLGFTHIRDSKPNYFYVVNKRRENRFKYRKSELVKQGFDKDKSEHEIMRERGIPRIYDCGNMVFELKF